MEAIRPAVEHNPLTKFILYLAGSQTSKRLEKEVFNKSRCCSLEDYAPS